MLWVVVNSDCGVRLMAVKQSGWKSEMPGFEWRYGLQLSSTQRLMTGDIPSIGPFIAFQPAVKIVGERVAASNSNSLEIPWETI